MIPSTTDYNFTLLQPSQGNLKKADLFIKKTLSRYRIAYTNLRACDQSCNNACQNVFEGNCQTIFDQNALRTYRVVEAYLKNNCYKKTDAFALEEHLDNLMHCVGRTTKYFLNAMALVESLKFPKSPSPQANVREFKKARKEATFHLTEKTTQNNPKPAKTPLVFTFSQEDIAKSAANELGLSRKRVPNFM